MYQLSHYTHNFQLICGPHEYRSVESDLNLSQINNDLLHHYKILPHKHSLLPPTSQIEVWITQSMPMRHVSISRDLVAQDLVTPLLILDSSIVGPCVLIRPLNEAPPPPPPLFVGCSGVLDQHVPSNPPLSPGYWTQTDPLSLVQQS